MDSFLSELTTAKVLAGAAFAITVPFLAKTLIRYFKAQASKYIFPNELDFSDKSLNDYFNKNYEECLVEWSKKYPDGCTIRLNPSAKILVLNSVESIREFSKNDGIANRPQVFLLDVISHHYQGSFFRMYDADLNEIRKTTLQGLHKLVLSNPDAESLVSDELERFFEFVEKEVLKKSSSGVLENAMVHLQQILVNIVLRVALGVRFDYDLDKDAAVKVQMNHMTTLLTALNIAELAKVTPENASTPAFSKTVDVLGKVVGALYDFITGAIVGYKQNANPDDTDVKTLADMLLQKQRDEIKKKLNLKSGDIYSDDDIIVQVFTAFLATSGTSGFTLAWALRYLSQYTKVAEKVAKEINSVSGDSNFVSWKARSQMLYTEATIEEILRLSSTQALIPRGTCTEVNVNGVCVPANTPVILNTFGIHHNPDKWSEANEFKPERWINKDGKSLALNKDCFMPFGAAPRTCVGDTLSKALIFSVLTNMVNRYSFEYIPVGSHGANLGRLGVMRAPHEFNLKFTRRN